MSISTMARPYNSFARLGDGILRFSRQGASGPRVTLLGGVHGNERIGVRVLDALRLALLASDARVAAGASVTLVYANTPALRVGTRGAAPHADLNRCFAQELLAGAGTTYEEVRARELAPLLAQTDVLVDLHSTNKPSAPFVRLAGPGALTRESVRLATRLPCEILLHDPKYLLADGRVALTDEYVGAHGGVGVCFESGLATDLSAAKVDSIVQSLWTILTHDTQAVDPSDRVPVMKSTPEPAGFKHVYEITQVFKLTEAGFRWADGVGESNFQRVAPRQPIGFVGDEPFAVDYESFIVFPKVPALWKLGAPLGWLTKRKASM